MIIDDYLLVSEGHHRPTTRDGTIRALRILEEFLARSSIDSEDVTIHTIIALEKELLAKGFTSTRALTMARIRGYYQLKGSARPGTRWSQLAVEIKAHRMPKTIGKPNPHKPFPLFVLPKVLQASRELEQETLQGELRYNQAPVVVATLLYTGTRAQIYGLEDKQVREALKKKYVELFVKEGEWVYVPVPDQLLAIWKKHLEARDFEGPMFFRYGRTPYTYQGGNKDWSEDVRASRGNEMNLVRMFRAIEQVLRGTYQVDEVLTAHRFRKSVGTFMAKFGFDPDERRLQLSHGAKTITDSYDVAFLEEAQKKLSKIDLGDEAWILAHTEAGQPRNLFFVGGDNGSASRIAQLEALLQEQRDRNDRLEKKLDQVLANQTRVIA